MRIEHRFVGRWGGIPTCTLIAAVLAACSTSPLVRSGVDPRELPIRVETGRPLPVSRDELDRYRCASGAIMRCEGSTAMRLCTCP